MRAYRECCAVCRLRHAELLDAAHILPDGHPKGEPVRQDILGEADGPMLRFGLQGFHLQALHAPRARELRPSAEFLAERFELFRKAG